MTPTTENKTKKPIALRVIFILNAIMTVLPYAFYYKVTKDNLDFGFDPAWMLYTAWGYTVSFAAMVYFILKRNIMGLRVIIVLNVLISLPAKAFIGIGVALISMLLSFFNGKVKAYFGV